MRRCLLSIYHQQVFSSLARPRVRLSFAWSFWTGMADDGNGQPEKFGELANGGLSLATSCEKSSHHDAGAPGEEVVASGTKVSEGALHEDGAKPLSKNAQKKLLKMERYKAKKMERKAFEKSKRHEDTERKRKEWESKFSALSPEEQEALLKEQKEKRRARQARSLERKNKLRDAMESGQNLVIDLEFCDRMKPNELASLVQQVMYSYSMNAKAALPARLSLTGCKGEVLDHLKRVSGFENWLLHKEHQSYLEVFKERKQDLVYLTADSTEVIEELDQSKIYIIGGLVDRNRWKGLTLEKAKSEGISTARLPILNYMRLASSPVLTVNQVVEIFLRFMETKSWENALEQAIPSRKRSGDDVHDNDDADVPRSKLAHQEEGSDTDSNAEEACEQNDSGVV
ncbi:hypothetical protein KP509_30G075300 [Ceratopteris richardii]|uniref:tRNA (guanine(9)-N(1))-methyltransferase n=1 Tax=Ceratopteris richardii TaxID=49495 RepID=A0A8T2R3V5_CERRI|nr:hypothetical protein KP509_30G075300 [Ceratopteris richardii]